MENMDNLKNIVFDNKLKIFKKINDGVQKALFYTLGEKINISDWIKEGKNLEGKQQINQNSATLGKIIGIHLENFIGDYIKQSNKKVNIFRKDAVGYDIIYNDIKYEIKTGRLSADSSRFIFAGNLFASEKSHNMIFIGYKINEKLPIGKKINNNFIIEFYFSINENINLNSCWLSSNKNENCAMSSLKIPSEKYDELKKGLIHGTINNLTPKEKQSKYLSFSTQSY